MNRLFSRVVWGLKTVQFVCLATAYFVGTLSFIGIEMMSESRKAKRNAAKK